MRLSRISVASPRARYKDNWETFIANSGVKLFFGNDDHFTRDYVSKLMGDREIIRRTETYSRTNGESRTATQGWSAGTSTTISIGGSVSQSDGKSSSATSSNAQGWSSSYTSGWSETIHRRPLLNSDEVGRVFGDRSNPSALALLSGSQPLFLKRALVLRGP